ncbi:endonuclease domain-containing 1 protein-like [Pseudorasbora parva]|uniref:endonuclease domain-containing 1 protein-like n=1 Tax=Pseudorasbora parva TaxID=51549 RepID=UPI00351F181E
MRLLVIFALLVLGFPSIMAEVVDSFSKCSDFFIKNEPPEIEGVLKKSVSQDEDRYKLICQKYDGQYRFATLYDIREKIPVFSAYKFTAIYKKNPHIPWMIEPQLEPLDGEMSEPGANQAVPGDYWNQKTLDRGHLFPNSHAADEINAESTYTQTNSVPQESSFNSGSWKLTEQSVRELMNSNCRDQNNKILAYVLTGAVPGNTRLNNRVNIPSYMWTVFCCYNAKLKAWESKAYWAENKKEKDPKPIDAKTVEELEDFLWKKFKKSSLLSDDCYAL